MKIENIADHLDLLGTLAQWHEKRWGAEWAERVRQSTCRDRIPTIYIALDNNELVGSAMLVARDMTTRTDLTPWLGVINGKMKAPMAVNAIHSFSSIAVKLRIFIKLAIISISYPPSVQPNTIQIVLIKQAGIK